MYFPSNSKTEILFEELNKIESLTFDGAIIGGDPNVRSPSWGG